MNEKLYELLEKVQETAVQVGDTAADAAYGMGKKACALLSVAKLNIRIADLRSQVNLALREAGELLYATHTGNPTDSQVLLDKLEQIDGLNAQIAELEAQAGRTGEAAVCPTCGAAAQAEDQFCRECGGKL